MNIFVIFTCLFNKVPFFWLPKTSWIRGHQPPKEPKSGFRSDSPGIQGVTEALCFPMSFQILWFWQPEWSKHIQTHFHQFSWFFWTAPVDISLDTLGDFKGLMPMSNERWLGKSPKYLNKDSEAASMEGWDIHPVNNAGDSPTFRNMANEKAGYPSDLYFFDFGGHTCHWRSSGNSWNRSALFLCPGSRKSHTAFFSICPIFSEERLWVSSSFPDLWQWWLMTSDNWEYI